MELPGSVEIVISFEDPPTVALSTLNEGAGFLDPVLVSLTRAV